MTTRFLSQPLGSRDQLPDCHPHRVHLPSSLSLLHKPVPGVSSALDFGRKSQTSGVFVPHIVSLVHLKLPHPRRSPNLLLPLCLADDTLARTAPTPSRRPRCSFSLPSRGHGPAGPSSWPSELSEEPFRPFCASCSRCPFPKRGRTDGACHPRPFCSHFCRLSAGSPGTQGGRPASVLRSGETPWRATWTVAPSCLYSQEASCPGWFSHWPGVLGRAS